MFDVAVNKNVIHSPPTCLNCRSPSSSIESGAACSIMTIGVYVWLSYHCVHFQMVSWHLFWEMMKSIQLITGPKWETSAVIHVHCCTIIGLDIVCVMLPYINCVQLSLYTSQIHACEDHHICTILVQVCSPILAHSNSSINHTNPLC